METRQGASPPYEPNLSPKYSEKPVRKRRRIQRMACTFCGLRVNKYSLLHSHMLLMHDIRMDASFVCHICQLICKSARGLWTHLAVSHWKLYNRGRRYKRSREEMEEGLHLPAQEGNEGVATKEEFNADWEERRKTEELCPPGEKIEEEPEEPIVEAPHDCSEKEEEEEQAENDSLGESSAGEHVEVKSEAIDESAGSATLAPASTDDSEFLVFPCPMCSQRLPRLSAGDHLRSHHTEVCVAYHRIDDLTAKIAITKTLWELVAAEKASSAYTR